MNWETSIRKVDKIVIFLNTRLVKVIQVEDVSFECFLEIKISNIYHRLKSIWSEVNQMLTDKQINSLMNFDIQWQTKASELKTSKFKDTSNSVKS